MTPRAWQLLDDVALVIPMLLLLPTAFGLEIGWLALAGIVSTAVHLLRRWLDPAFPATLMAARNANTRRVQGLPATLPEGENHSRQRETRFNAIRSRR